VSDTGRSEHPDRPPGADLLAAVDPDGAPVRAAGGAVWRRSPDGSIDVILIHRPRYDDWSLPKGKVDLGETDEAAAAREVREEASVEVRLGAELPTTTYLDRSGRQKRVRYWAMTVTGGEPAGDNEVDVATWVSLPEARRRLSYSRDAEVLDALDELLQRC
jgi:8-oxo-dGTP diphosphatase